MHTSHHVTLHTSTHRYAHTIMPPPRKYEISSAIPWSLQVLTSHSGTNNKHKNLHLGIRLRPEVLFRCLFSQQTLSSLFSSLFRVERELHGGKGNRVERELPGGKGTAWRDRELHERKRNGLRGGKLVFLMAGKCFFFFWGGGGRNCMAGNLFLGERELHGGKLVCGGSSSVSGKSGCLLQNVLYTAPNKHATTQTP